MDINKKIIQLIRDYDTNTWGLKSDDFIMKYCSFYPLLVEAVLEGNVYAQDRAKKHLTYFMGRQKELDKKI